MLFTFFYEYYLNFLFFLWLLVVFVIFFYDYYLCCWYFSLIITCIIDIFLWFLLLLLTISTIFTRVVDIFLWLLHVLLTIAECAVLYLRVCRRLWLEGDFQIKTTWKLVMMQNRRFSFSYPPTSHSLGQAPLTWQDDVIKWKHFPRYWPCMRGIHRSAVNSPHKGQQRGALMFLWSASE